MFAAGHLAGKTVNVKTYSRHESVLDISPHPCDYYLVLTGPAGQAREMVGTPLVQRRRDGQRLTAVGRVLLDASRTVLAQADQAVSRTCSPPASSSPT